MFGLCADGLGLQRGDTSQALEALSPLGLALEHSQPPGKQNLKEKTSCWHPDLL